MYSMDRGVKKCKLLKTFQKYFQWIFSDSFVPNPMSILPLNCLLNSFDGNSASSRRDSILTIASDEEFDEVEAMQV